MNKPFMDTRRIRRVLAALLTLGLALAGIDAQASIRCTVSSSGMAFGSYDPSDTAPTDSNGSVVVSCANSSGSTTSVSAVLKLDAGSYRSFAARRMQRGGGQTLDYNLYRDSARSQIWGADSGGYSSGTLSLTGIAKNQSKNGTFTVYGRIPALQNAVAGSYSDNVTITLTP